MAISKRPGNITSTTITSEERKRLVAETAYFLAQQRGFGEGCQLHDWLEAEERVDHIHGKAAPKKQTKK